MNKQIKTDKRTGKEQKGEKDTPPPKKNKNNNKKTKQKNKNKR